MAECEECGADVNRKNAAGHYDRLCWDCLLAAAYIPGDEPKRPEPRPQDRA